MLFFIAGCAWIAAAPHQQDLTTAKLSFVSATGSCDGGLRVLAEVPPGTETTEILLSISPANGTAPTPGTFGDGVVEWDLPGFWQDGSMIEITIMGALAQRSDTLQVEIGDAQNLYEDIDLDGFGAGDPMVRCIAEGWVADGTDCDDTDPTVRPNAQETCSPGDRNCDGDEDRDALDATAYYPDLDGDGAGDALATPTLACTPPAHSAPNATDCDDTNPAVNPDATEVCNGFDDNCDGVEDQNDPHTLYPLFYFDGDNDNYGVPGTQHRGTRCDASQNQNLADNTDDCDDTNPAISPGAPYELCDDGIDNNCNGLLDIDDPDIFRPLSAYEDADGDDYGGGPPLYETCGEVQPGQVTEGGDCNDGDPLIHPHAIELCDGIDSDCDAEPDSVITLDGLNYNSIFEAMETIQPGGAPVINVCGDLASWQGITINQNVTIRTPAFTPPARVRNSVTITAGLVVLENLELVGDGSGTEVNAQQVGGAIAVLGGTLSLRSVHFQPDTVFPGPPIDRGGALYVQDALVTFGAGSSLAGYEAQDKGGGIYVVNSTLIVEGNTEIRGNQAPNGGGLYLEDSALSLRSVFSALVVDNHADQDGGGLYHTGSYNQSGVSTLGGLRIEGNTAARGAGMALFGDAIVFRSLAPSTLPVPDIFFEDNTATRGGAIYTEATSLTFETPTHFDFNASLASGAAIEAVGSTISGTATTFDGNEGDLTHAAIGLTDASFGCTDCTFGLATANTAFDIEFAEGTGVSLPIEPPMVSCSHVTGSAGSCLP